MNESLDSITLKNNIPIISYKTSDLLSKSERHLSKFFKCCSKDSFESEDKCFWSGNDVQEYKVHIQTSHKHVFCSYCVSDKASNDGVKSFATEDADQLIEHLFVCHERRVFQCNRCQYRANTSTHIQLHQMSIHYPFWAKNNTSINYESLGESNICKMIVCKPIIIGPDVNHSILIPKFSPNLDTDLAQNLFYCLFCDYANEEQIQVFMHCVHKHRDFDICVYHKECPKEYCFNDSESEEIIDSDDSDSDEPKEQPTNGAKSLVNNFETLSFQSTDQSIPGLNDEYVPLERPPFRPSFPTHRDRRPKGYGNIDNNKEAKRKLSYDSFFEDNFEDSVESPPQHSFAPTFENNTDIRQPFIQQSMANPPFVQPIDDPCVRQSVPTPIQQKSRQESLKEKKKKKWYKFNKIKSNEKFSEMTYGEYKRQQQQNSLLNPMTSTPQTGSQIPPEINLEQTQKDLGLDSNESALSRNSFKKINRIGVSSDKAVTYVTRRDEEESDEYMELLKEKIPKRGVKARFESHNHFELTPLQSNQFSGKNLYKCVICVNEPQLRENNIALHLKNVHNTESSLKCGFCDYIGHKPMIISHSKVYHPNQNKIEKFIVNINQKTSIGFTSETNREKPKTTARKSTSNVSNATKGAKGALTQRIRDSTYLGPLKNDVTTKRKSIDSREPSQRVYSRSAHSSNIRPKKRPKLVISSESESEIQTQNDIQLDYELSDIEMASDYDSPGVQMDSPFEYNESDDEIEEIPKKVSVAKKSTSKPSSQNESQVSITLTEEQIPTKYFCVFCSESFIINEKSEAIEHYKTHLKLGYSCGECHQFFISYSSMEFHWHRVHNSESEMNSSDNMSDFIRQWIVSFLDNQIQSSDFAENIVPNSTGINITCPLCVKAAKICNSVRPRAFDALWKVKLHICKHLNWFQMKCNLCENSNILFPNNPYLLVKHLIDCHFTSCENLHNISFRGQKPFNDMKREQLKLIDRNFSTVNVFSSDIINSFFNQLMIELDLSYENQLKAKYKLTKEIQIKVDRWLPIKTEPIDEYAVDIDESEDPEYDLKDEFKSEDKKDLKDIKVKTEFKTEIKSEFKTELKPEVKDENKSEVKDETNEEVDNEELRVSGNSFYSRLYGDEGIASTSGIIPKKSSAEAEEITLSSDSEDES